jgi:hypothetical protein
MGICALSDMRELKSSVPSPGWTAFMRNFHSSVQGRKRAAFCALDAFTSGKRLARIAVKQLD